MSYLLSIPIRKLWQITTGIQRVCYEISQKPMTNSTIFNIKITIRCWNSHKTTILQPFFVAFIAAPLLRWGNILRLGRKEHWLVPAENLSVEPSQILGSGAGSVLMFCWDALMCQYCRYILYIYIHIYTIYIYVCVYIYIVYIYTYIYIYTHRLYKSILTHCFNMCLHVFLLMVVVHFSNIT